MDYFGADGGADGRLAVLTGNDELDIQREIEEIIKGIPIPVWEEWEVQGADERQPGEIPERIPIPVWEEWEVQGADERQPGEIPERIPVMVELEVQRADERQGEEIPERIPATAECEVQGADRVYVCLRESRDGKTCNQTFIRWGNFRNHRAANACFHSCRFCIRDFPKKCNRNDHERTQHGRTDFRFFCRDCGQPFRDRGTRNRHYDHAHNQE